MDRDRFRKFLKREGKSPRVTEAVVAHVEEFEDFLQEQKCGKELDKVCPEDLDAFISWLERDEALAAKKYLLGIRYFYEFRPNEDMALLASFRWNERMAASGEPLKLKEFRGVRKADLAKLESAGIKNANEIIRAGRTPVQRKELAAKTGIPVEMILELVKLSDLARIQGVKGIRARLYYDAGVDTIEKMSKWNSEKLKTHLVKFVRRTEFEGIAPLPKEVKFTVETAKRLPRLVEY